MLAEKTFIGQRLDLEHYKNVSIVNQEAVFVDKNGDPYLLTDFSEIRFDLFAKPHGKQIHSEPQNTSNTNVIYLNVPGEVFNIRPTLYYYEIWGTTNDSPALDELLSYGIFELI